MISRLLQEAREGIEAIGAGNPRLEAELLLAHALGRSRTFLFTHPETQLTEAQQRAFRGLLARRLDHEPLQYVLGTAIFRHLTLRVRPGVLIPRSETEILVERAYEALLRWRAAHGCADAHRPWVIDVGVGSGAILLGLLDEARRDREGAGEARDPWFRPLGIDIAIPPLRITAENAECNGLPRPHLFLGDLVTAVEESAPVAAVVSNPPYISTAEMADLPAEIREHEPHEALHGGADGLRAIRELLDQSAPFLESGALLCFEIGATQEAGVRDELAHRGLLASATITPDLAGRPRVVLVES